MKVGHLPLSGIAAGMVKSTGLLGAVLAFLATPVHGQEYRLIGPAPYCNATVIEGPNPRGASSSTQTMGAVILIDRDVLAKMPFEFEFVLAHECGHHLLGHTSIEGMLRQEFQFRDKELAADCWGARMLNDAGEVDILTRQLATFRTQGDARSIPRYPTFRERAERLHECIGR